MEIESVLESSLEMESVLEWRRVISWRPLRLYSKLVSFQT